MTDWEKELREKWQGILTPEEVDAIIDLRRRVLSVKNPPSYVGIPLKTVYHCLNAKRKVERLRQEGKFPTED